MQNANNPDTFRTSRHPPLCGNRCHRREIDQGDERTKKVLSNKTTNRDIVVLLIEAELRNSEIHGIGLFCREAIPKGTKVWAFDPLFDLVFNERDIPALPKPVINFMKMYAYRSRETNELIVNVDLSKHMNHADSPTLVCDEDSNYYAVEDLPAGTEMTCDYRVFAVEGCSDFLDGQASHAHAGTAQGIFPHAVEN